MKKQSNPLQQLSYLTIIFIFSFLLRQNNTFHNINLQCECKVPLGSVSKIKQTVIGYWSAGFKRLKRNLIIKCNNSAIKVL